MTEEEMLAMYEEKPEGPKEPPLLDEEGHINRVNDAASKGFAGATLLLLSGGTDILLRLVRGLVDIALKGVNDARKAVGTGVTIIVVTLAFGYAALLIGEKAWEGVVWYTRDDTQITIHKLIGTVHNNTDQTQRRIADPVETERLRRALAQPPQ